MGRGTRRGCGPGALRRFRETQGRGTRAVAPYRQFIIRCYDFPAMTPIRIRLRAIGASARYVLAVVALMTFGLAAQQTAGPPPIHARAARRLVIKNAMVIYGSGKPPYGPVDIVVQDGLINYIGPADATPGTSTAIPTTPRAADTGIDATG